MNILIVNPIIYTSETRNIKKVNTIKDTMIYDLCLGFKKQGHNVTLIAAENFKPIEYEKHPFEIKWMKCKLQRICPPHCLPFIPSIIKFIKSNDFDLIITSEAFSLNSLMISLVANNKMIIWQELAKHNKIFNKIPSKIWYNIMVPMMFRETLVVPRSIEAYEFISRYAKRVTKTIVDHGVNIEKFIAQPQKMNSFVVSSQLISRKRIDGIINNFANFIRKYNSKYILYIMGEGNEKEKLVKLVDELNISENVIFTDKLKHEELIKYLFNAKAMLVNTEKDNNMISIVESIAVGTPVITTTIPYNASYIKANKLGLVKDGWNEEDLLFVVENEKELVQNCLNYRNTLSTISRAETFINIYYDEIIKYKK
jgi:1,2-diacylglycerol 3-alpha-glucosyltransferase